MNTSTNIVYLIALPLFSSALLMLLGRKADKWGHIFAKVTKARLAALSINSIHIKTTIAFLRTTTPTAPIENRIADKYR